MTTMGPIVKFDLTDEQWDRLNDIEHDLVSTISDSYIIVAQIITPHPDWEEKRPRVVGRVFYDKQAEALETIIRAFNNEDK